MLFYNFDTVLHLVDNCCDQSDVQVGIAVKVFGQDLKDPALQSCCFSFAGEPQYILTALFLNLVMTYVCRLNCCPNV